MAAFRYRAVTLAGSEIAGVIEAETVRQARSLLREQGLFPLEVQTALTALGEDVPLRRLPRLGPSALMLLTRQWASLLEAGIPVERALAALVEQSTDEASRQLLAAVRAELLAGHPLHKALARFPRSFDSLYCALIAAGEQSGQLDRILARLADHLERSGALRQRLIQALVYPALVMLVAGAVILGLMTYVVPQVVAVFQSGKQQLPLLTRGLIGLSDLLRLTWPFLLVGGLLGTWLAGQAWRLPRLRRASQIRLMRLPALGKLLVSLDSARLAQTLAILIGSGVPLLEALRAGQAVVWLMPLQEGVALAAEQVREGMALHRALAQSGYFPPLFMHMVASGENSGRLDAMLDKAARQQSDELSYRLSLAMSLFEPLIILGMGLAVLLIVLAILQPIIEINQMLR